MHLNDALKWNRKKTSREAPGLGRRSYRVVKDVGVFRAEIMVDGVALKDKSQACADFEAGRILCQKDHDGILIKARAEQSKRHGMS
jgi:hypothetical protein